MNTRFQSCSGSYDYLEATATSTKKELNWARNITLLGEDSVDVQEAGLAVSLELKTRARSKEDSTSPLHRGWTRGVNRAFQKDTIQRRREDRRPGEASERCTQNSVRLHTRGHLWDFLSPIFQIQPLSKFSTLFCWKVHQTFPQSSFPRHLRV